MSDPKLVVTKETWDTFTPDQKLKITYDTAISTRETIMRLEDKVDVLSQKPCSVLERVEKLEKHKYLKTVVTAVFSLLGGFGGSHNKIRVKENRNRQECHERTLFHL